MVFQRYTNGYDACNPPVCPQDIKIIVDSWSCSNRILYVTWVIEDVYDRTFTITNSELFWSCDNRNFNNSVGFATATPYSTNVDISSCSGLVYFKVKTKINGSVFESGEYSTSISECRPLGENMVRATLAICDVAQTTPDYNLYVNEAGVPTRPVYFNYDNFSWFIDEDAWDNRIKVDKSRGTVIDSVTEEIPKIYYNAEDCCSDREGQVS